MPPEVPQKAAREPENDIHKFMPTFKLKRPGYVIHVTYAAHTTFVTLFFFDML